MSAGGIRAGSAYVEIFAKDGAFQQALNRVQAKMQSTGAAMRQWGTQAALGAAAIGAPMAMALRYFASFDDVMRATQAATGATAAEMLKLRDAAMSMSEDIGIDPTKVAEGFMELLKAGMSLEQVLGGAGKAALQFAQVSGMAVGEAAVVMADAMAVFGVSGDKAANTLSAAADSSSTDIQGMAQSFAQVSAVAGLANQSIDSTAAALAILANNGIKGSDAGTSLKTMLMRLMAPADDAIVALGSLGLTVASFRNADGAMMPLAQIIGTLTQSMQGLDQAAKDDIFRRVFGSDAIRAAAVLTKEGADGFAKMQETMAQAVPVGEKFMTMMDGISGAMTSLWSSVQRVAVVLGEALAPSMQALAQAGKWVASVVQTLLTNFPILGQIAAGGAAGILALGTAAIVGGLGLQVLSNAFSLVTSVVRILPMLFSPVGLAIMAIAGAIALVVLVIRQLSSSFRKATDEMMASITGAKQNLKDLNTTAKVDVQFEEANKRAQDQLAAAQAAAARAPTAPVVPEGMEAATGEGAPAGPTAAQNRAASSATAGMMAPTSTLGTFGSSVGLGIGPDIANLQAPTEETAVNTGRMAQTLDGLASGDLGGSALSSAANRQQITQIAVEAAAATKNAAVGVGDNSGFAAVVKSIETNGKILTEVNKILDKINTGITTSLPGAMGAEIANRLGMSLSFR